MPNNAEKTYLASCGDRAEKKTDCPQDQRIEIRDDWVWGYLEIFWIEEFHKWSNGRRAAV